MVVLPEHRTQSAYLPEQPLHDLGVAAQIGGQQLSGLVGQVLKNRTGFEHADRVAVPSTIAGMRPLGEIARNLALNCSPFEMFTGLIVYGNSTSSRKMVILWPLGVVQ
jgi:hypothetical protein